MPDMIPGGARPTILVVEDEVPLLTLLRYNLEKQGFRVEEASDGQEALLRVSETKPDLVLLDWMLPQLSGLEVCRQLRRRPATRDLPIIMVTARVEQTGQRPRAQHWRRRLRQQALRHGRAAGPDPRAAAAFQQRRQPRQASLSRPDHGPGRASRLPQRPRRCISARPSTGCWNFSYNTQAGFLRASSLLDAVWGRDIHVEPRTVDVHIRRLRKTINGPGEQNIIRTVRTAGYALDIEGS